MQLVFTVTAGRTGTRSLAGLLAARLPGAHVHHEVLGPESARTHTPSVELRLEFNSVGNTPAVRAFWQAKFADIAARPCHTWVETSHLLFKGGLVENLDLLPAGTSVTLVALRRDRASLVRSYRRLDDFTRMGNRRLWYLDEKGRRNLLEVPEGWGGSATGLALWYALEVECRQAWLRRMVDRGVADHVRVEWLDLEVAELSGSPRLHALVSALRAGAGLPPEGEVAPAARLNKNPAPPLPDEEAQLIDRLTAQVATFDPGAYVDRRCSRGDPFAPTRPLPPLARPHSSGAPGVFIGGPGRSGTTALVDLLGCHPRLSPVYETDPLPQLLTLLAKGTSGAALATAAQQVLSTWAAPLPLRPHNKAAHERYLHGPHHVRLDRAVVEAAAQRLARRLRGGAPPSQAVHDTFSQLFAAAAAADGKPRWLNKTPSNVSVLPFLLGVFPRARFLLCVRDPRDVALSVVDRAWGPRRIEDVPRWWRAELAPWLALRAALADRVRVVRYEDLVCAPRATLDGALAFLGEDAAAEDILKQQAAAGIVMDPARIGRWRSRLTAAQVGQFRAEVGFELDLFGYGGEA